MNVNELDALSDRLASVAVKSAAPTWLPGAAVGATVLGAMPYLLSRDRVDKKKTLRQSIAMALLGATGGGMAGHYLSKVTGPSPNSEAVIRKGQSEGVDISPGTWRGASTIDDAIRYLYPEQDTVGGSYAGLGRSAASYLLGWSRSLPEKLGKPPAVVEGSKPVPQPRSYVEKTIDTLAENYNKQQSAIDAGKALGTKFKDMLKAVEQPTQQATSQIRAYKDFIDVQKRVVLERLKHQRELVAALGKFDRDEAIQAARRRLSTGVRIGPAAGTKARYATHQALKRQAVAAEKKLTTMRLALQEAAEAAAKAPTRHGFFSLAARPSIARLAPALRVGLGYQILPTRTKRFITDSIGTELARRWGTQLETVERPAHVWNKGK